jgi:phosphoglycerate dehydrogenase-like enzyme
VAACTAAGVFVTSSAPELEAPYVAEHSVAQALALLRELRVHDAEVRARGDDYVYTPPVRGKLSPGSVVGATIGLVGAGPLSAAIAKALVALGCAQVQCLAMQGTITSDVELVAAAAAPLAPLVKPSTLPELLAACDVVFLTCELTTRTRNLIDGAALATLKPGAVIINASSGSLIDESAVGQSLHEGTKLGGYACAGLACDERRPGEGVPPHSHPDLVSSPRALLGTGACATAVLGAAQRVELEAARSLAEALTGRKPSGARNDVQPRLPGAAPTSEVAKAGGLASYLWCF